MSSAKFSSKRNAPFKLMIMILYSDDPMFTWKTPTRVEFSMADLSRKLWMWGDRIRLSLMWLYEHDYISEPKIDFTHSSRVSFDVNFPKPRGDF
jgi:hypothetical protein